MGEQPSPAGAAGGSVSWSSVFESAEVAQTQVDRLVSQEAPVGHFDVEPRAERVVVARGADLRQRVVACPADGRGVTRAAARTIVIRPASVDASSDAGVAPGANHAESGHAVIAIGVLRAVARSTDDFLAGRVRRVEQGACAAARDRRERYEADKP
jgi:hypothetical protein